MIPATRDGRRCRLSGLRNALIYLSPSPDPVLDVMEAMQISM